MKDEQIKNVPLSKFERDLLRVTLVKDVERIQNEFAAMTPETKAMQGVKEAVEGGIQRRKELYDKLS